MNKEKIVYHCKECSFTMNRNLWKKIDSGSNIVKRGESKEAKCCGKVMNRTMVK